MDWEIIGIMLVVLIVALGFGVIVQVYTYEPQESRVNESIEISSLVCSHPLYINPLSNKSDGGVYCSIDDLEVKNE